MDLDSLKVDRSKFTVARLEDPDDSVAYWLTRTVEERLQALELLRLTLYEYPPPGTGFQRVLEIAKLGER